MSVYEDIRARRDAEQAVHLLFQDGPLDNDDAARIGHVLAGRQGVLVEQDQDGAVVDEAALMQVLQEIHVDPYVLAEHEAQIAFQKYGNRRITAVRHDADRFRRFHDTVPPGDCLA